ncbi:MAG: hypothetical protein IJW28_00225 [Clostridia bacterium]|nr:hypothetical protein [Clostridia bacterium]
MTDEEIIDKVLDYIENKTKDLDENEWSKEDDTVSFVCHVISILGEIHDAMDIGAYLSDKTKNAFYEIDAKEYGDAFDKAYTSIVEDSKNVKGFWLIKSVRLKKLYNKHIETLYNTLQEIEKTAPIIETHLLPYMKKHYAKVLNGKK